MASTKDLKKRITTVKNTQQTTRAMKVVSAAKLRRAQEAILNQRPYANQISGLIRELTSGLEGALESPLLGSKEASESNETKKILLVLVTSDRGLCGGFNSAVMKAFVRWMQSNPDLASRTEIACVGRKGYEFFKTKKVTIASYYSELGGKVTFAKAKTLADDLRARYLSGSYGEVKFIYNEFKNAASQQVRVEEFLPFQLPSSSEAEASGSFIVKPTVKEVLNQLLEKNFAIQAFKILLESQAGEHGARMSAMENATKNAGEMIRKLTLQYNKQRQAGITTELLEIIAGSESQKG